MNVLVIPEDFRRDQYVLKPIIEAMLRALGSQPAKVRVCLDPLLGGIGEALKRERIEGIISRYPTVDLFLLCVDRDGDSHRRAALDGLEKSTASRLRAGARLYAEHAWQELEVWVLAGHDLPSAWRWREIRAEVELKEKYFEPFARTRGLLDEPGQGRKTLATEAARRSGRIRDLCPEDIGELERRIKAWER
jgi:hypothetical protein